MVRHAAIVLVVVAAAAGVLISTLGQPDAPTEASSEAMLARRGFAESMPTLAPGDQGGDAADDYRRAIALYLENADRLKGGDPPAEIVDRLARHLLEAMQRRHCAAGFLDEQVPLKPGGRPEYEDAPFRVGQIVLDEALRLVQPVEGEQGDSGRPAGAATSVAGARRSERLMLAVWTLGRRLFEQNVRIAPRKTGLALLQNAAVRYETAFGPDAAHFTMLKQWADRASQINVEWERKIAAIQQQKGNAGDLIRIAEEDEDVGFRVMATLRLGAAQWLDRRPPNLGAIEAALKRLSRSREPLISRAAAAAKSVTRQDVRNL